MDRQFAWFEPQPCSKECIRTTAIGLPRLPLVAEDPQATMGVRLGFYSGKQLVVFGMRIRSEDLQ
jgi:hypothetical protein